MCLISKKHDETITFLACKITTIKIVNLTFFRKKFFIC